MIARTHKRGPRAVRFTSPILIISVLSILALVAPDRSLAQGRIWENFTNIRAVSSVTAYRDTIWLATSGGLVWLSAVDPSAMGRLTNADGLGSNTLEFVVVDSAGSVWSGGPEGRLSRRRSDTRWDVFTFADDKGLPIALRAATPGSGAVLWVGSTGGVHKFDTERHGGELKESYLRLGTWPDGSGVNDLVVAGEMLWVAGEAGAARARAEDDFLLIPDHWDTWGGMGPLLTVTAFNGTVYAGGDSGLLAYLPESPGSADSGWVSVGLTDRTVVDLLADGDTLWVTTAIGPATCTATECRTLTIPGAIPVNFTGVARTANGSLWLGQDGVGVWERSGTVWTKHEFDGLPDNQLADVAVGKDGKIWCVLTNRGAAFLENGQWTELLYISAGPSAPAEAIAVAPNGDVWLGMFGAGAYRVDPDVPLADTGWVEFDSSNSSLMWHQNDDLTPNNFILVTDVAVDPAGRVWFANSLADSGRAIAFYDHGCWGWFGAPDGIALPGLRATLATTDNSVLIGTSQAGVLELKYSEPLCAGPDPLPVASEVTKKDVNDGLPSNTVFSILVDRFDSLWVGTNLGLAKWEPRFRRFVDVSLPPEAGLTINSLTADAQNGIWVGTTLGLVHLAPDGAEEFFHSGNSGLVGDDVRSVTVDETTGSIWIATTSGLSRVNGPPPAASSADDIFAYPNPVEITGNDDPLVQFAAPVGSRVYLFTIDGRAVAQRDSHLGWNCRNGAGRIVETGIYLYVVRGADGEYGRGKIAILNRR